MLDVLVVALQVVAGVLIADFISGFVHWLEDAYGETHWPIVGPAIAANILHHETPLQMVGVSYLERNGPTMLVAALIGLPLLLVVGITPFSVTALLVGGFANELHTWAHRTPEENGRLIRALQKTGLIVSFEHHAAHHRRGKDSHYCTVTSFLNPVLDRITLWRGLELAVWLLFGTAPRCDHSTRPKHRRSIPRLAVAFLATHPSIAVALGRRRPRG